MISAICWSDSLGAGGENAIGAKNRIARAGPTPALRFMGLPPGTGGTNSEHAAWSSQGDPVFSVVRHSLAFSAEPARPWRGREPPRGVKAAGGARHGSP